MMRPSDLVNGQFALAVLVEDSSAHALAEIDAAESLERSARGPPSRAASVIQCESLNMQWCNENEHVD